MKLPEYDQWDALATAERIASRDVSAEEVLEAAIERIEARNPAINAVVYKAYDAARASLRGLPAGPLHGVPMLLKNLVAMWEGHPQTRSCRFLCPQPGAPVAQTLATEDSVLVARLKAAGVVLLGTTNTPELGLLGVTEPALYGPTRNPWALDRVPGGSSGGSGAAVAARLVPVAHGGDGGGSLRIPASANGVVGLKPTRGRISQAPMLGEAWGGFVQEFVLTRSIRDCALMLDVLSSPVMGDPHWAPPPPRPYHEEVGRAPGRLRIGFTAEPLLGTGSCHPDCRAALMQTVALLQGLGHELEEARPDYDREGMTEAYMLTVAAGLAAEIRAMERMLGQKASWGALEPATWFMRRLGESLDAPELVLVRARIDENTRRIVRFFERYDVLITPTLAAPPVKVGQLQPKPVEVAGIWTLTQLPLGGLMRAALRSSVQQLANDSLAATPNTQLFNMTGQPAISLPLMWNGEGLPVGIQCVSRFGEEGMLLRLGSQLEQAQPWQQRLPPTL
ncbi:MAG: amidase [Myxococcota bacterium]